MPNNLIQPPTPQTFKTPADITPEVPVTIRPDFKHYMAKFGWFRVVLIIGLFVFALFRFGPEGGLALILTAIAVIGIVLWRLFSRSLTVTETELIYKSALGTTRKLALQDIGAAKMLPNYADASFGHAPRFLIGKKDQGYFVSLLGVYFHSKDMERIAAALDKQGVKIDIHAEPYTWSTTNRTSPTLVHVLERHPILIAILAPLLFILPYIIWYLLDSADII